ncbi:MAG: hypothetical protein M1134_07405 [Actinobacteria bacterium]|nr:hypothetical protein [Actinomycetota bacterium]
MSGEVLLSDEGGTATRLLTALATLMAQVRPGAFALIGGLAVMTRLQSVHRATDDIDGVTEQRGDHPSDVAIVLGESGRSAVRRLIEGVKIDHIDVSDTPAAQIPAADLPESEWDKVFVLAHRWGFDSATPVTISAVKNRNVVATVACLAASPGSLVAMKLQSAPRRPPARIHKAANDYFDLYRLLSNAELVPEIAHDLVTRAPHDLGAWAIERIRIDFIARADDTARAMRRGGPANEVTADEIEATAAAFLVRVADADES